MAQQVAQHAAGPVDVQGGLPAGTAEEDRPDLQDLAAAPELGVRRGDQPEDHAPGMLWSHPQGPSAGDHHRGAHGPSGLGGDEQAQPCGPAHRHADPYQSGLEQPPFAVGQRPQGDRPSGVMAMRRQWVSDSPIAAGSGKGGHRQQSTGDQYGRDDQPAPAQEPPHPEDNRRCGLLPRPPRKADEGTRTLDLLHGKETL